MGAVSSSPNEIPTPQLCTRFKVISKHSATQAYLVYAKHLLSLKFMLLALTQELLLKSTSVAILPSWEGWSGDTQDKDQACCGLEYPALGVSLVNGLMAVRRSPGRDVGEQRRIVGSQQTSGDRIVPSVSFSCHASAYIQRGTVIWSVNGETTPLEAGHLSRRSWDWRLPDAVYHRSVKYWTRKGTRILLRIATIYRLLAVYEIADGAPFNPWFRQLSINDYALLVVIPRVLTKAVTPTRAFSKL